MDDSTIYTVVTLSSDGMKWSMKFLCESYDSARRIGESYREGGETVLIECRTIRHGQFGCRFVNLLVPLVTDEEAN